MKKPGSTTEGVHSYSTIPRQLEPEQSYYDLTGANQPLTEEQQFVFDRAGTELKTHYQTELRSGLTGRRTVEYHLLNNNDETERDCLFMTGWGQSVHDPLAEQAIKRLAATHPETRWIIPTTPGLHGTDRLPQSILRGLRKGSFIEVGDYLLEAMRPARNLENPLDIYAYSQGSSVGMGVGAASQKDEIRDIRAIDPAALQRRSIIGMLIASQVSEAHSKKIWETADADSLAARNSPVVESSKRRLVSPNEIGGLIDMYVRYPIAMGRAALWPDAERALDKISGDITAIIGDHSEYNKMPQVQAALARSALVGTGLFRLGTFNGFHGSIVANTGSLAVMA